MNGSMTLAAAHQQRYQSRQFRQTCQGIAENMQEALKRRIGYQARDGHYWMPRIKEVITHANAYYLVVFMDAESLYHFSEAQLTSEDTLAKLSRSTGYTVRAVTRLNMGGTVRHVLAYVVTIRELPAPRETLAIEAPLPASFHFDPIGDYPAGKLYQWCIGHDGSRLVWKSIRALGHILVAGTTQWGKTSLVKTGVITLTLNHKPELLRLAVIDPKGVNTSFLDNSPHLLCPVALDGTLESARSVMRVLSDEVDYRRDKFRRVAAETLEDYNTRAPERGLPQFPLVLGLFDEFADMVSQAGGVRDPLFRMLGHVTGQGAGFGVQMILSTQTPKAEIINSVVRSQCDTRIVLHCTEAGQFKAALGVDGYNSAMGKLDRQGRALARMAGTDRPVFVQSPYLDNDAILAMATWRKAGVVGGNGNGHGEAGASSPDLAGVAVDLPLTDEARRLVAWAMVNPERYRGGMSQVLLAQDFDRDDPMDDGAPIRIRRIREAPGGLKARGLLERPGGLGANVPYQITAQLQQMISV